MVSATANGKSLTISPKYAMMVCQYIRGKSVHRAKAILQAAIVQKEAVPFTRFNDGVGHRTGIAAAGRYPKKACEAILMVLKSAEANAINKEMTGELIITNIRANRASSPMRYGRQSRRQSKRAHVHITLEESAARRVTKKTKITAETPESTKKTTEKPAVNKTTTPAAEPKPAPKAENKEAKPVEEKKPEEKSESKEPAKPEEEPKQKPEAAQ